MILPPSSDLLRDISISALRFNGQSERQKQICTVMVFFSTFSRRVFVHLPFRFPLLVLIVLGVLTGGGDGGGGIRKRRERFDWF